MSRDCGGPVRKGLDSWMEWIKSGLVEYRPMSDKRPTGWWWYEVKRRWPKNGSPPADTTQFSPMTWIYGWPFPQGFALQYATDRQLFDGVDNLSELARLDGAATDITRRAGLPDLPLKCCWVHDEAMCVFALAFDYEADTPHSAHAKLRVKDLPRRDRAFELARLLGIKSHPRWYRYADGSWNPRDGELRLHPDFYMDVNPPEPEGIETEAVADSPEGDGGSEHSTEGTSSQGDSGYQSIADIARVMQESGAEALRTADDR